MILMQSKILYCEKKVKIKYKKYICKYICILIKII